jgi:hypothetical protein
MKMRNLLVFIVLFFGHCTMDSGKKQNNSENIAIGKDMKIETNTKSEFYKYAYCASLGLNSLI